MANGFVIFRRAGLLGRVLAALSLVALAAGLLASCQGAAPDYAGDARALSELASEPLATRPWNFGSHAGVMIATAHYHIWTTIEDPLYRHLLAKLLEADYTRGAHINPLTKVNGPLDCYVFAARPQWETYTRVRAGSNAPIYLQISAGGYCQEGVFAGYDIGRDQTLSVVAHEAWHQYAYFAFRDRLPAWLDEGLATQNEAIEWVGTMPTFRSELNYRRYAALKDAIREKRLWKVADLVSTHAGRVIKMPQKQVDAYYAQLWSLVLFLQNTPRYNQGLQRLLADANDGRLTQLLVGTGVSQNEIDRFTEKWNAVAGPIYLKKYISADVDALEREYEAFNRELTSTWPPKLKQ